MEPPSKRPRFSFAQDLAPDLDLPPTAEVNEVEEVEESAEEANPLNLEEARARNDQRLKSIFESIFAKYEKDFTEVGDEIDLQSGRIIVNNGHLQRMEGEDDTGEKDAGWLAQLSTPVHHEEGEEEGSASGAGSPRDGYDDEETQWSESTELPVDGDVDGDGDRDGAVWEGNRSAAAGAYSGENENDDDDDDDDTSSVDSLLDSALSVNRADRMRHPARVTTAIPSTKKAIPAVETAGDLYRVRDAVACSNTTTTTTTKHKLVDPKWRVPDIDSKFTQSAAFSSRMPPKPPSANNKKNPSNPSDKTTFAHSVSPPGARSLWAVPLPGRPRKTNTDAPRPKKRERQEEKHVTEVELDLEGEKQKQKEAKERDRTKDIIPAGTIVPDATPTSASKLKPYSSPMIASNWSSFSRILDGSDSDDPLQEYQPSPTPTASLIRGRRMGSEGTTPSRRPQSLPQSFSHSQSQSPSQSRCNGCRRLFPGNEEHVLHLRSVLASGLSDGQHDGGMVRRILEKIDGAHARDLDSESTESTPSLETYESPSPPPLPEDTTDTTDTNKPATNHRARARAATPDEVKLIITMRHVQRKPWKEILDHFPGKRSSNLIQWNQLHWTERRARPPPSSGPWSVDERGTLSVIKDEQGLSWAAIRKKLPRRTTVEIEFELLRLWVGDRVWNGEAQAAAPGVYHRRHQQTDGSGDLDPSAGSATLAEPSVRRTIGDKTEIPNSRETSIGLSDQEDGHTPPPRSKSNADSFGILYEDQQPFDSIEYDDEPGVDS